jgi:hypothetical protein
MKKILAFILIVALGCKHHDKKVPTPATDSNAVAVDSATNIPGGRQHMDSTLLFSTSISILTAIKNKDYKSLAGFVHPLRGLLFSPYAFIDTAADLVIQANELELMAKNNKSMNWNSSWDEDDADSLMTIHKYFNNFVYDVDFLNAPLRSFNEFHSQGTDLNNVKEVFPASDIVEYFFSGFDKKYGGMDYRGLRLVFESYNGKHYLVAIVHDKWTP